MRNPDGNRKRKKLIKKGKKKANNSKIELKQEKN